jgi:ABC-type uncharacterized transport system permease subunit
VHTLRVSWLFFKVGVLNELQYRVNFVVSSSSPRSLSSSAAVSRSSICTRQLNGWSQSELLCVLGIQI